MTPSAIPTAAFDLTTDAEVPQGRWHRHATRLRVDSVGIVIEYGPRRVRELPWDDPRTQFVLLDYRESPHNRPPWVRWVKEYEFRFRPEIGLSAFPIPEKAFDALASSARAAGLALGPAVTGGGIPAGTRVYHFARRPPRWWTRPRR